MAYRPTERACAWGDWLHALTEPQREAVTLCWVEGYTMREAGDVLGIAHESVRDRLDWARRKFGGMTAQAHRGRVEIGEALR